MTVGDLKKQFERLGADDNTELYLVDIVKRWNDITYNPICVGGFQQKGVAIFFMTQTEKE